jgi:hypothetical protein
LPPGQPSGFAQRIQQLQAQQLQVQPLRQSAPQARWKLRWQR